MVLSSRPLAVYGHDRSLYPWRRPRPWCLTFRTACHGLRDHGNRPGTDTLWKPRAELTSSDLTSLTRHQRRATGIMRLFFALMLPPAIQDHLCEAQEGLAGARWVETESLHLTLRFLGELDRPDAEEVAEAMLDLRAPVARFRLAGVDMFSGPRGVRSLWAKPDPAPPLAHLAAKVDRLCHRAGLGLAQRAFRPHVTLGRCGSCDPARVGEWLQRHNTLATPAFEVPEVSLVLSHLGRDGPHYEVVAIYPLDDDPSGGPCIAA